MRTHSVILFNDKYLYPQMQKGVDHLLFNLIVLGSLVDQSGRVWRRDPKDLYVIESLPLLCWELSTTVSITYRHRSRVRLLGLFTYSRIELLVGGRGGVSYGTPL